MRARMHTLVRKYVRGDSTSHHTYDGTQMERGKGESRKENEKIKKKDASAMNDAHTHTEGGRDGGGT